MGLFADLYHGETRFDFPRMWRKSIVVSGVLMLASILALIVFQFNLGIEFEGGTSWEVKAPGTSVAEARDVLRPLGEGEAKIQVVDGDTLRIQSAVKDPARAQEIASKLTVLGEVQGFQSVGPSWGREITDKAIRALVVFFVLLAAFISWRLEWKMAVAALIAVVHDILISAGVYALFQIPVTPATVVSFLTILGYSLYDTIVVFDKVLELTGRPAIVTRYTYTDTMNLGLNQVLMRSLNTTIMGVLPVVAMLIVGRIQGADTLLEFAVALLVGMVVGAYSSIFVAAPIVARLKEREPRHRSTRQRLAARGGDRGTTLLDARELAGVAAGGSAPASGPAASRPGAATPAQPAPAGAIPPRPRKKKRR